MTDKGTIPCTHSFSYWTGFAFNPNQRFSHLLVFFSFCSSLAHAAAALRQWSLWMNTQTLPGDIFSFFFRRRPIVFFHTTINSIMCGAHWNRKRHRQQVTPASNPVKSENMVLAAVAAVAIASKGNWKWGDIMSFLFELNVFIRKESNALQIKIFFCIHSTNSIRSHMNVTAIAEPYFSYSFGRRLCDMDDIKYFGIGFLFASNRWQWPEFNIC